VIEGDQFKDFHHSFAKFAARLLYHFQSECNVLVDCHSGKQLEVLENDAYSTTQKWHLSVFHSTRCDAFTDYLAFCRLLLTIYEPDECRLAGSAWSHYINKFSMLDVDVDSIQCRYPIRVRFIYVLHYNHK